MTAVARDDVISRAAHDAVRLVSPSEEELLRAIMAGPGRRFARDRGPVGFGFEDVANWASPAVLAVAIWYSEIWISEGKSMIERKTRSFIRGLSKRRRGELPSPPDVSQVTLNAGVVLLDPDQRLDHVRRAQTYLIALGMEDTRAEVAAIAVVDSVLTSIGAAK